MSDNGNGYKRYAFADFQIETAPQILRCGDSDVHLAKRPFQVLNFLIENRERVVSRDELLDKFWDGHDVYDDALRKSVASIRKALKDNTRSPRFIETRYGDGYRFISDVTVISENGNHNNGHLVDGDGVVARSHITVRRSTKLFIVVAVTLAICAAAAIFVIGYRSLQTNPINAGESLSPQVRSIIVMPIRNISGDAGVDYLSEGVTDSLLTQLSRSKGLRIIPGGSIFSTTRGERDPISIGRELNAETILEGSLQKRDDKISIRMRLVQISDGTIVWTSNDFERAVTDAYDLQEIIACDISVELRSEICGEDPKATRNGRAYQEYVKGRHEWNKRTPEGIKQSIEHYKLAIEIDPMYSLAYAGLADSYTMGLWYVPFSTEFAVSNATTAARKAIELDVSSAEAHTALASVSLLAWRWDEAGRELQRAGELNPNYARAHHVNAFYLTAVHRYDEAIASIRRAHELDPLNSVIRADVANILLHGHREDASRIDAAIAECHSLIASDPNYAETYDYLATAYWLKGDNDNYAANLLEGMRKRAATEAQITRYSQTFRVSGVEGLFRLLLRDEFSKQNSKSPKSVRIALYYAVLGDKNATFKWLERSVSEHNAEIISLSQNVFFDPVRSDTRFQTLLHRVGLPEG